MNAELIDLYRGVQKYRGEWRPGDRYFDILHREYGVLCDFCDTNNEGGLIISVNWLWLPPVWSDDERCLWKMVDWENHDLMLHDDGSVSLVRFRPEEKYDWDLVREVILGHVTLPEALLRAIREQEAGDE